MSHGLDHTISFVKQCHTVLNVSEWWIHCCCELHQILKVCCGRNEEMQTWCPLWTWAKRIHPLCSEVSASSQSWVPSYVWSPKVAGPTPHMHNHGQIRTKQSSTTCISIFLQVTTDLSVYWRKIVKPYSNGGSKPRSLPNAPYVCVFEMNPLRDTRNMLKIVEEAVGMVLHQSYAHVFVPGRSPLREKSLGSKPKIPNNRNWHIPPLPKLSPLGP